MIVGFVTGFFIKFGEPIRIHLLAKRYNTSSAMVRKALDAQLNGFDYYEVDLLVGDTFSGKFVRSWAVEPSKTTLRKMINKETA